uniref:Uncharacterized protein n=1 Tax=Rousettus aegyptiacus TaxID=9407 RepID=A0A7J8KBA3_ROUAE|nr:hypothetical protein HJG63_007981 [Rousettus aegyptiacus]
MSTEKKKKKRKNKKKNSKKKKTKKKKKIKSPCDSVYLFTNSNKAIVLSGGVRVPPPTKPPHRQQEGWRAGGQGQVSVSLALKHQGPVDAVYILYFYILLCTESLNKSSYCFTGAPYLLEL